MIEHLKFYFNKKIFKRCLILMTVILLMSCYIRFSLAPYNKPYRNKGNNLLNLKNFHYITSNEICTDDVFLLILIHSAPNHFHHRNVIRNTWGRPDAKISPIKIIFLLAASPEFQEDIEKENYRHSDIVQGNFIDSYHNLTYKHAMGLKWASEHCSHADYFMKMDDDIFMDVFQFVEYVTKHFTPFKLKDSIACFLQSGMPVVRDPVSKWYVSKKEYTQDVFENYCSGWAYLTTTNVASLLYRAVQKLDYFWVDDVHITGAAAKIANVSYIKINSLFDLESGGLVDWSATPENLNWNKMFAPTWGDLVLSRKAYRKSLQCWVVNCKCCYSRKAVPQSTQASTTHKGIAKLIYI